MNIKLEDIVKKIDVEKLVAEGLVTKIIEYVDVGDVVDEILEEEKLKDFIRKRIIIIIDEYLSSDDGKDYIIERFEESITDSDILIDDRIKDIIIEFLKKRLR